MEAKSEIINHLPATQPSLSATSCSTNSEVMCPSCEVKLKPYEVAQHCEQEIQCLRQLKSDIASNGGIEADENSDERRKPWTVFQRVQRNRQSRLKRTRRRQAPVTEHPCPICSENFPQDEIHAHTEKCLRRNNATEDDSSNEEDDDVIEEYEWAGQKRIRVSSLLRGGYASLGIGQNVTSNGRQEEDDEDLNVDEDDTHIYGPPQFGESDVITPESGAGCGSDSEVTNYVRRLITEPELLPIDNAQSLASNNDNTRTESAILPELPKESTTSTIPTLAHYRQIIESLSTKLRQYEKNVPSKFKCLICLDEYRNPAISVSCWHVHCEECWLRSLGARKLCPQCNLITTPKDLRRIYM